MKKRIKFDEFIQKNLLLFGIVCAIFLAAIFPYFGSKNGPLKTDITVKYVAVSLIFFISGLSIETHSIYHTFRNYKLHLFIQCFTFIFIPIFTIIFIKFCGLFGLNDWILKGLITVSCMPPPVSSAVILTRAARGNEAAAIFNSVLGSFIGIILTPLLLLLNLGSTTIVPLFGTVIQLTTTVLIPLALGQGIKQLVDFKTRNLPLNNINQMALLFIVYTTFCDTFLSPEPNLHALDLIFTMLAVFLMQIILMAIAFTLGKRFRKYFRSDDIIAIVFCSTHKSLTLGLPILRIMFHGYSHLSQISLPLLIYHPIQIILGSCIVPNLKEWGHEKTYKPPV